MLHLNGFKFWPHFIWDNQHVFHCTWRIAVLHELLYVCAETSFSFKSWGHMHTYHYVNIVQWMACTCGVLQSFVTATLLTDACSNTVTVICPWERISVTKLIQSRHCFLTKDWRTNVVKHCAFLDFYQMNCCFLPSICYCSSTLRVRYDLNRIESAVKRQPTFCLYCS